MLPHVRRGFWTFKISEADSRVGNARVAVFFPPIEGSICIRREGRAENNVEDDGVDLLTTMIIADALLSDTSNDSNSNQSDSSSGFDGGFGGGDYSGGGAGGSWDDSSSSSDYSSSSDSSYDSSSSYDSGSSSSDW